MLTLILNKSALVTSGTAGIQKHAFTTVFHQGIARPLNIFFKDGFDPGLYKKEDKVVIKGRFQEDINPFRIQFFDVNRTGMPTEAGWKRFLVDYFLEYDAPVTISEYSKGAIISPLLEHYYVWCDISKDGKFLNKAEFGRYLSLEKPEHVRKDTSWTKGVFNKTNSYFIEFRQSSWLGEEGNSYSLAYSDQNREKLVKFLEVPFQKGWIEKDYRLGKDSFYKASGCIGTERDAQSWTFTLLNAGEQDIPFATDRINQFLRTKWADSFFNSYRRHIDETVVPPIK
jgi:hypothetical protein